VVGVSFPLTETFTPSLTIDTLEPLEVPCAILEPAEAAYAMGANTATPSASTEIARLLFLIVISVRPNKNTPEPAKARRGPTAQ